MATATQGTVRHTYKDYCATPDDERYELINGNLMVVPAPNWKHQSVLGSLYFELRRFNQEHQLGHVCLAPFDVFLSDTDVVQPDVLFISRAREYRLTDKNVRGAPGLVIEILSHAGHRGDAEARLVRTHEPADLPGRVSRANQAVAPRRRSVEAWSTSWTESDYCGATQAKLAASSMSPRPR